MRDWDRELTVISDSVQPFSAAVQPDSPWNVLVATIISLRTKDAVTLESSRRLLSRASDPRQLLELGQQTVEKLIYPAGFYRKKAENLVRISEILIDRYHAEVPSDRDALMDLPGVGLKTANLVLSVGFGIPAICVDIHVHRIANRRGWIATGTPDQSEAQLRTVLPQKWWILVNHILVVFGQNICTPVSPHCSRCPVREDCPRTGVQRFR